MANSFRDVALGRHILVEFINCAATALNDVSLIETAMVTAAQKANATVINSTFHHFSPYGVSGVVVIEESHLAIHTWPEFGYAAVDIFTCGDTVNPWIAYDHLKTVFQAQQGSAMEMRRGQIELLQRTKVPFLESNRAIPSQNAPKFTRNVWLTDKNDNTALSFRYDGQLLYKERSDYQTIKIVDSYAFGKILLLDDTISATEKDEFIYHEMLVHPAMCLHPSPKQVLIIGGGDGGAAREVLRHPDIEKITIVEIDSKIPEACLLHLPELARSLRHPKVEIIYQDATLFLEVFDRQLYDIILVDSTEPTGPSEHLFTGDFYKRIFQHLAPDGILAQQSQGPFFNKNLFINIQQTIYKQFGKDKSHAYLAHIPSYPTGMWGFALASKKALNPEKDLRKNYAKKLSQQHQLGYYDSEIHTAAFVLPPFIKKMLTEPPI